MPSGPDLTGKKETFFVGHTFLLKGNTANSTDFKERQTFYFLVSTDLWTSVSKLMFDHYLAVGTHYLTSLNTDLGYLRYLTAMTN